MSHELGSLLPAPRWRSTPMRDDAVTCFTQALLAETPHRTRAPGPLRRTLAGGGTGQSSGESQSVTSRPASRARMSSAAMAPAPAEMTAWLRWGRATRPTA